METAVINKKIIIQKIVIQKKNSQEQKASKQEKVTNLQLLVNLFRTQKCSLRIIGQIDRKLLAGFSQQDKRFSVVLVLVFDNPLHLSDIRSL